MKLFRIHLDYLAITGLSNENLEKDGKTEVERDTLMGSRSEDTEPGKKETKSDTELIKLMSNNKEEEEKREVSPDIIDDVLEVDP